MSKENDSAQNNQVVITAEDCNAALDFWKHFNIPVPKNLEEAIAAFATQPTFENQNRVKLEICKAIATTDHEAFRDEMFSKIVEECEEVTFDMVFDRQLEDTLTTEEK